MSTNYFKDKDDVWYAEFTFDDVQFDPVHVSMFTLGPDDYEARLSSGSKEHITLGFVEVSSLYERIKEAHRTLLILEQEQC